MKRTEKILNISKNTSLGNLKDLKDEYIKDPFGFIENYHVDFKNINYTDTTLTIIRKTNILSPYRGTGRIEAKIKNSDEEQVSIQYSVKPEFDLKTMIIVTWFFVSVWILGVLSTSSEHRVLLLLFGLGFAFVITAIQWFFTKTCN